MGRQLRGRHIWSRVVITSSVNKAANVRVAWPEPYYNHIFREWGGNCAGGTGGVVLAAHISQIRGGLRIWLVVATGLC